MFISSESAVSVRGGGGRMRLYKSDESFCRFSRLRWLDRLLLFSLEDVEASTIPVNLHV